MLKDLFRLNSPGNLKSKKHTTVQNVVFRCERAMKKILSHQQFFINVHESTLHILLTASQRTKVGQETIMLILWMENKSSERGCIHVYSNSEQITK